MPEEKGKHLNPEQQSAVTHGSGPLLIIAGAGTGKTLVITQRVEWLISRGLAQPSEILALTFTEKAAKEMEERIDQAMPYGYTQMWVMTFHSFCDRLLRDEGLHIGISPNYRLVTEADSVALLKKHLFEFNLNYFRPLGNPTKFIGSMLQHFGRLQDEDISSGEYLDWAKKQTGLSSTDSGLRLEAEKYLELAYLFEAYSQLKTASGLMDFSDLICTSLQLLRSRPNILGHYRQKFKYILVDEFQDTNYAQNQLVSLLAGPAQNVTVVADDDQSIYRWRGAAISNVIQFRNNYPAAAVITLTQNYRSTQEVLDRSYSLIQHNNPDRLEVQEGINKKLTSARKTKGSPVTFLHYDRVENEAEGVVKEIQKLTASAPHSLNFKDIAILVRANAHAEAFVRSLSRHNIPYQFLGPTQLFRQPEIKDLICYLRVLHDFTDDASFYRVLSMEYFAISARDLAALGSFARRFNLHLFEACEALSGYPVSAAFSSADLALPYISPASQSQIKKLIDITRRHLGLISSETAGQILFYFLQDTGLLKSIMDYRQPLDEKKANNIMKFFNKLKSFESEGSDASVDVIINWIDLSTEVGESPTASDSDWTENNAVNIITVHSAKGLEFPAVFIVNLVSQRFPSMERKEPLPIPNALIKEILPEGDYHLQEERRLFYVAMTRACDYLYLTASDFYGEGKRTKKISPFVFEALGPQADHRQTAGAPQLSLLEWQKNVSVSKPSSPGHAPLAVSYLSYSQIQTFIDCPLHYKAKYILKIPTPAHAASSFGNTVHLTLKEFYEQVKRGTPHPDIAAIFANKWLPEGYLNKTHAQSYYDKGLRFLAEYVDQIFDPHLLPEKLEEPFTIPLDGLKIGGKIDRVDVLPDGTIEIIDYKTSAKSLTEKEAATNLQLSMYALAATRIKIHPFDKTPEQIKLSLFYLEEMKKVTTTRTASQLEAAIQQIYDNAKQISESDFACSQSMICKSCDFAMLCDLSSGD